MLSILNIVILSSLVASASATTKAYYAKIVPFPPSAPNATFPPSGFATIFTDSSSLTIGYAGIVNNVGPGLLASTCNTTNGCGVHIHTGRSCANVTTQGGHYYNNVSFPVDPWINERYSSDTTGKATFQSIVQIGSIDVEGRVFVVHSMNGTRIGCGIIERAPTNRLLETKTSNLTASGVTSDVVLQTIDDTAVCYFGSASKLEPNLVSYLNENKTLMGNNCNFTNGCGVHIHNGTSCFNRTTQGGHYYNEVTYPIDPWLYTMYHSTDRNGNAYFTGCVESGVNDFANRPFVLHSDNGTRVSCGRLRNDTGNFILINPSTDVPIGPLPSTIDYSKLSTSTLNIMATFTEAYKSAMVTFDNPRRNVCEKIAPFSVFGDNQGNFAKAIIPVGRHRVEVLPYINDNCTGITGKSLSKNIVVKGCKLEFVARDVSTKAEIFRLPPATVTKTPGKAINIEAVISCGFRIQDVQFVLRDNTRKQVIRRQTEVSAPYYVFPNRGTSIRPGRTFAAGSYSLSTLINDINHGTYNFTLN